MNRGGRRGSSSRPSGRVHELAEAIVSVCRVALERDGPPPSLRQVAAACVQQFPGTSPAMTEAAIAQAIEILSGDRDYHLAKADELAIRLGIQRVH
jgi:hypothetical protein